MKSKKYEAVPAWDDVEEGQPTDIKALVNVILNDDEISTLEEIIIGYMGECYENDSQPIFDMFVENSEKFVNFKSLFVGDIEQEECEISWIEHGKFDEVWQALPNLEKVIIQGSEGLSLGNIKHDKLKHLEIISVGLSSSVLVQIQNADLPALEKLMLYLGIDDYCFDGDLNTIADVVEGLKQYKSLKYLGLVNSLLQNHIAKIILDSGIANNLEILDLSHGTFIYTGAKYIINNLDKIKGLKNLIIESPTLSYAVHNELYNEVTNIGINITLDDVQILDQDITSATIHDYYSRIDCDFGHEKYLEYLKINNMDTFDLNTLELDQDSVELISDIACEMFDIYPLYTE